MEVSESNDAQSTTPESSPMTRSFDLAAGTIDDLTALADLNRVKSPEPSCALTCCCGRDECENTASWSAFKSRLENRLILSAEVGQALLQKHEAHVRQVETKDRHKRNKNPISFPQADGDISPEEKLNQQYDELAKENAELQRRFNHALVNNEVTEVSNKTLLHELQEARETISRLTTHHARSIGWDTRLTAALKERDDMQQERDGESHRARLAESRFAALKDKTAKLQTEVRRLQESLEEKRQHRLDSSDSILVEARTRLESVRSSQSGIVAKLEQDEITRVLETLVNDNETLKRDNRELQRFLTESREDLHALQEEVEEQRANMVLPRSGPSTPLSRHFQNGSISSVTYGVHGWNRKSLGGEPFLRPSYSEPLTPDSNRRPLSPADSPSPSEMRWNSFNHPRPRHTSSHASYEVDDEAGNDDAPESERPKGHRPLLLLTRSRAVQTETWLGLPSPSIFPSHLSTPPDPRSESSSYSESLSSHVSSLLERATALLNRMTQADALTLTNRLKRQHLKGADVGHLSRSTVSNVVAEAIELRSQFRFLLEDENLVVTCTRKDLRVLFKLLKDVFMELGQLRVTLNDVILDPSCAHKVSDLALNPSKATADKERDVGVQQAAASWIAPISRLFSASHRNDNSPGGITRSTNGQSSSKASRLAPKLGPALAASTTTVNVEFSGAGVGRATTTIAPPQATTSVVPNDAAAPSQTSAPGVMNIFAGAPKPSESDPWVVLPKGPRRVQSFLRPNMGTATIGRSEFKKANRLSRNVDAIIDVANLPESDEEGDSVPPLLERSLHRRGLSDSSIHSTFTSHGEDLPSPKRVTHAVATAGSSPALPWTDGASVFQALTRTVQHLRLRVGGGVDDVPDATPIAAILPVAVNPTAQPIVLQQPQPQTPGTPKTPKRVKNPERAVSPGFANLIPNITLASWAATNVDMLPPGDLFISDSLREESFVQRHGTFGRPGDSRPREFY